MTNEDTVTIRAGRLRFWELRNGPAVICREFRRDDIEETKAAWDSDHPDAPSAIVEKTAIVMPEALYLSKRGRIHFKTDAAQ